MLAVLVMGVAIGATWVGLEVQATGCVSDYSVSGACMVLPRLETWVHRAVGAEIGLFAIAIGAQVAADDRTGGESSESGTAAISNE